MLAISRRPSKPLAACTSERSRRCRDADMADYIHKPPRPTIYVRTDYIVNSDLSIQFAVGRNWLNESVAEGLVHTGFPANNRHSVTPAGGPPGQPITAYQRALPKGRL